MARRRQDAHSGRTARKGATGVVVSRVNLSPRFMEELIEAMEDNYSKWKTREGIKNLPEFDGQSEDDGEDEAEEEE